MENLLQYIHSWVRWGVLLVALIAMGYMVSGWLQQWAFAKRGHTLMTVFSSLVGVQWLLGILLLLQRGAQNGFGIRHYWEHTFMMTVALVVAHGYMAYKRREIPDANRFRNNALVIVATFAVIFIGVLTLPSGIQWRLAGLG